MIKFVWVNNSIKNESWVLLEYVGLMDSKKQVLWRTDPKKWLKALSAHPRCSMSTQGFPVVYFDDCKIRLKWLMRLLSSKMLVYSNIIDKSRAKWRSQRYRKDINKLKTLGIIFCNFEWCIKRLSHFIYLLKTKLIHKVLKASFLHL